MGLILDSSVVIASERRGDTVEQLIEKIVQTAGDQEAALSAIGGCPHMSISETVTPPKAQ
jgi:hypothetical protein